MVPCIQIYERQKKSLVQSYRESIIYVARGSSHKVPLFSSLLLCIFSMGKEISGVVNKIVLVSRAIQRSGNRIDSLFYSLEWVFLLKWCNIAKARAIHPNRFSNNILALLTFGFAFVTLPAGFALAVLPVGKEIPHFPQCICKTSQNDIKVKILTMTSISEASIFRWGPKNEFEVSTPRPINGNW